MTSFIFVFCILTNYFH